MATVPLTSEWLAEPTTTKIPPHYSLGKDYCCSPTPTPAVVEPPWPMPHMMMFPDAVLGGVLQTARNGLIEGGKFRDWDQLNGLLANLESNPFETLSAMAKFSTVDTDDHFDDVQPRTTAVSVAATMTCPTRPGTDAPDMVDAKDTDARFDVVAYLDAIYAEARVPASAAPFSLAPGSWAPPTQDLTPMAKAWPTETDDVTEARLMAAVTELMVQPTPTPTPTSTTPTTTPMAPKPWGSVPGRPLPQPKRQLDQDIDGTSIPKKNQKRRTTQSGVDANAASSSQHVRCDWKGCSKTYPQIGNLNRHKRNHFDDKRHVCTAHTGIVRDRFGNVPCRKNFVQKTHMNAHLISCKRKKYGCDYIAEAVSKDRGKPCTKRFDTAAARAMHVEKEHRNWTRCIGAHGSLESIKKAIEARRSQDTHGYWGDGFTAQDAQKVNMILDAILDEKKAKLLPRA